MQCDAERQRRATTGGVCTAQVLRIDKECTQGWCPFVDTYLSATALMRLTALVSLLLPTASLEIFASIANCAWTDLPIQSHDQGGFTKCQASCPASHRGAPDESSRVLNPADSSGRVTCRHEVVFEQISVSRFSLSVEGQECQISRFRVRSRVAIHKWPAFHVKHGTL